MLTYRRGSQYIAVQSLRIKMIGYLAIIFAFLLPAIRDAVTEEMSCCSSAAGSCRSICSKFSLVSLGADPYARENATKEFSEFCSAELVEFWDCVNSTFKDVERNEHWTGRSCCHLARNPLCRGGCAKAGGKSDLDRSCRWSDEPNLADCLEEREEADECCSNVTNSTCRGICKELFRKPTKSSSFKVYSSRGCFPQVPKCLKDLAETKTSEDPKLYLHCCEETRNMSCLLHCRRTLHASPTIHDALDALPESCGVAVPHHPLWKCFLQSEPSKDPQMPMNIGKLACCSRAARRNCQNLCWRAFHADWESWQTFESTCLTSSLESDMRRCLDDAEDSCEIGCSGLSFCSRFNDRPTTLFRTCTKGADESAKWEADHWVRGGIISGLGVPVRAAPSCPVDTLRAAACLLQLRPCESRIHETRLCREDCMELMTSCVDWSAVKGHNAATLCAKLSPPKPDMPCVSMKPFLEDPTEHIESTVRLDEDINMPCKNNPCPQEQICMVHPEKPWDYYCIPGCPLGTMSKQLIPVGSWAQMPQLHHRGCYRICQCSAPGHLENCKDMSCLAQNTCWVQNSFVAHRSSFFIECNPCYCFEGEVICSRKSCADMRIPGLPCDCPNHYVPVCGRLGVTYASACLAKCSGLLPNEVEYNSCSSKDPCASNPCGNGEKCLRKPKVCLSPIHKPCTQYECVPLKCDHREDTKGPVCDTDNRQHLSLCSLIRSGSTLAYRGPCLQGCSLRGPVCGINGENYASECAAWAERTIVDYHGACVAVGLIGDEARPRCGDSITCPPLARPFCVGTTPPGACCPVCGGAARLFYSRKQLDRIYYQLPEEVDKYMVTLEAMLDVLTRQLLVVECTLRGMVTPEGDIFVVIQPVSKKPSDLQLSACIAETEKIVSRIAERSPRVVAEVPLSSVTRAEIAHSRISSDATGIMTNGAGKIVTVLVGLVLAVGVVS